ncbi:hypothetical protein AB0J52_29500, partial [Spirillospora sp. NPDC049652]
ERARTFLAPVARLTSCSASREALGELTGLLAELERSARADLSAGDAAAVVRSVGIRFVGQAHAFTVELPAGPITPETVQGAAEEFYKRYHESYGIDLRDPAELTTARVRVTLPGDAPPGPRLTPVPSPAASRRIWLPDGWTDVPVRARASHAPGDAFDGPCVVTEPQCSLLVPPGWRGTVDDEGAILLEARP